MNDPHARTRSEQAEAEPEHEHVAELLRAVDMRAPERLHERVQAMVADGTRPTKPASSSPRAQAPRRHPSRGLIMVRLKPTLAAMAIAAGAGAAIALLTGGSAKQSLSVQSASALTLRAATMAAPGESRAHAAQLDAAVDGVAFPYWERLGWRSTGARTDTLSGHRVTTVFYASESGGQVGYAIVGGAYAQSALANLRAAGTVTWRGGVPYRLLREGGAQVVVWRREGRLCVLSGRGVSGTALVRLASWGDGGPAA